MLFIWETGLHLHIEKRKKLKTMKTQNNTNDSKSTSNNETRVFITWGNEQTIVAQFKTMDELVLSGYVDKYASNFGYEHLVKREMERWAKYQIHNVFVTSANPTFNYGLDFKIWINYTADGINFMKQLSLGSSSLTSAPLQRVNLNIAVPAGFDFNNIENNSPEIIAEWCSNIQNNVYSSFEFSTNAFYKKDLQFRQMLRHMSAKNKFIFA